MKKLLIFLGICSSFIFCKNNQSPTAEKSVDPLASHIDTTVKPQVDFFEYANGNWFKNNPIPASESVYGIFKIIQDTINNQIKSICENAMVSQAKEGTNEQKIGDYYASGMDTISIEKAGIQGIIPFLKAVDDAKSVEELLAYAHTLRENGVHPFYSFWIAQDDKKSTDYAVFLGQGGLSLPEREYYMKQEDDFKTIRNQFVAHINNILSFAKKDYTNLNVDGKAILNLETDLAKISRKIEDLRDPVKNYNKVATKDYDSKTSVLGLVNGLNQYGLSKADSIVVGQPDFFSALVPLLKKYPIQTLKSYMQWQILNDFATTLPANYRDEHFDFYGKKLNGIQEQKPRWKKMVENTDESLGELIGQIYVEKYLPKGTKEKLFEMGNSIKAVYATHIKQLDWMSEATKTKALDKLNKINMKFGYPDKWKDMSNLKINRNNYLSNVVAVNKWEFQYMLNKYGKPVDKTEWGMTPQTYNAYYDPTKNEIVVPGCNIIVPGYERQLPDDAILYSIIGGSTIGHEITHGFDDQGAQYDAEGNLHNWWTKEDSIKFFTKTKMIVDQFNQYEPIKGIHVNGAATQGENIADLGGIVMGYEAFKNTNQGKSNEKIAGYTGDQRFFLGYGFAWMMQIRKEKLTQQLLSDVHSPAKYRVNGPLVNMEAFQKAWNIQAGDPMYKSKEQMIKIW